MARSSLWAALLVGLPAFALIWLAAQPAELAVLERENVPVVVPAGDRTVTGEQQVGIVLEYGTANALRSPGFTGTITDVLVDDGAELRTGDPVIAVDRVLRVAAATEAPFHRGLRTGDRGPDVAELQALLGELRLLTVEPDGVFGGATRRAVDEFARQLGVARPNGVFDRSLVIWLPSEPYRVGVVDVEVGDAAPQESEPLATGAAPLTSAGLVTADGTTSVPLDEDGDFVVEVDGELLTVDAAEAAIAAGDLPRLAALVEGGAQSASGTLRLAEPQVAAVVPSAAVMPGPGDALCVWLERGTDYEAVAVTVGDSGAGTVDITSGIEAGDLVLANPISVLADPACR